MRPRRGGVSSIRAIPDRSRQPAFWSVIRLAEALEDDPDVTRGYMGHDEFAVGEGSLLRRFPVYREGDNNAAPTGGTRQIRYKLEAGEAGWGGYFAGTGSWITEFHVAARSPWVSSPACGV